MVSCVFISMVCVPMAHADGRQGSITLNVQPSQNSEVKPLNNDSIVNGNGLKKQRLMANKCARNATYRVKYESWNGLKRGTLTYGVYVLNEKTCEPIEGARVQIFNSPVSKTNAAGYVETTGYPGTYVSDSNNTWLENYNPIHAYSLEHYYTPEDDDNEISCMVSERNEVKDCKKNTISYNYYYIDRNGLIGAILLYPDPSDPPEPVKPEPVLTSMPLTGEYTLPIVIGMVLIAGITIVFIHRGVNK